jgi:hypothetical protein
VTTGVLSPLAEANTADPLPALYQYGAVGILAGILLLLSYRLLKKFEESLDLERAARRRAEDVVEKQNEYIRDRLVPTMEKATAVMAQTLHALRRGDYGDPPG